MRPPLKIIAARAHLVKQFITFRYSLGMPLSRAVHYYWQVAVGQPNLRWGGTK